MYRTVSFQLRCFFQIFLLTIFLIFFGVPYAQKYLEHNVMVVNHRRQTGGVEAPAITILARNPHTNRGWKDEGKLMDMSEGILMGHCMEDISVEKCIREQTYNQSEVVNTVTMGFTQQIPVMETRYWTEDFTSQKPGRSFTIRGV